MQKQEQNNFTHILFNILIPVLILNKGHKYGLNAQVSLILALSFPLFFTLKSLLKNKKFDFVSLLGLLNVLVSGVFTLLTLEGIWFAVKEAAFPFLIGCFVFGSSFTATPFFETLFLNPSTFNVEKIENSLETTEKKDLFAKLMAHLTQLLSISFLLSAILNFVLAIYIFTPIAETTAETQKQEILNEQLSQMTLYSLGVILIPSMLFLAALIYYAFKRINKITGLNTEDLLKTN